MRFRGHGGLALAALVSGNTGLCSVKVAFVRQTTVVHQELQA